jgi:outer membrane protein
VFVVQRGQAKRARSTVLRILVAVTAGGVASGRAAAEPAPTSGAPRAEPPGAARPGGEPPSDERARATASPLQAILKIPGGLTAAQSGERAAATSPAVSAKDAEVIAAAARVDEALAQFLPRITGVARYARLSAIVQPSLGGGGNFVGTTAPPGPLGPQAQLASVPPLVFPAFQNASLLQANVLVPLSDYVFRLFQSHAAATHSERSAALQRQAAKLKAASDAQLVYYAWVQARLQVEVAVLAQQQADVHLGDARRELAAGRTSPADVLAVESQFASSELFTTRARNLAALLEAQLRTALHDAKAAPYTIGEDVLEEPPPLDGVGDVDALAREARGRRPELRAFSEAAAGLRKQAQATTATAAPRLEVFGNLYHANPNPRFVPPVDRFDTTWDVGAQLVWAPNDVLVGSAQRKGLRAQAASADAQRAALDDAIFVEVVQAWQRLTEAPMAIGASGRARRSAEESYRVRHEQFVNGRATSTDLTEAELALTRSRLEEIRAHVSQRMAQVQLIHAVGRDAVDDAN